MEREKTEYLVDSESHRRRLDRFLESVLPGLNRRAVDRLLRSGLVRVNDKPRDRRFFVKRDDRVVIFADCNCSIDKTTEATSQIVSTPIIIHHNPELIALGKPPHMNTVSPGPHDTAPNLLTWLKRWLAQRSPGKHPPGVLHRLDKETSGLVLFSLRPEAHRLLEGAWRRREIKKRYLGMISGRIRPRRNRIDLPLSRDRSGRMSPDSEGMEAITDYGVIEEFKTWSLLECSPVTGRTHQIRCHLRAAGFPLLGDPIYGVPSALPDPPAPRLWLRAAGLSLPAALAKTLDWPREIEAPLWPDLAAHLGAIDSEALPD